jgi:histidine phosphotransferase ChpT
MPFEHSLQLTQAVCARVCHDLAGPLGALAGTLELALEGDREAGSLALELAALLSARLTVLRAAWGGGEAPTQSGPASDPASLQPGLPGADRLRIEAAGLAHGQPDSLRRMVPPLLLLAASCMPRGGTITLSGGPADLTIGITGKGAAWPESLAACAASPDLCLAAPGGARGVAVPLACLGAHCLGLTLEVASATMTRVAVA